MSHLHVPGGAALLVAAAFLVYLPAQNGGFILDDIHYVTGNPLVKNSGGLQRIWFSTEPMDYWPLTNTTFWIEWRLWGMKPAGYHVTNFILHIADAVLIWVILSRLSIPGAWLAALLFTVHPVNVESVAWISQRKNVLSMLFFLLSILWYLKSDRGAGLGRERSAERHWYWLSLLAFTLAMLSKGSVAMLPVVLLLIAWWQRGTINMWDLMRTAPFFLVAVALAAVNVWFQLHGSGSTIRDVTLVQRVLGAAAVVWFYLYKALLPIELVFVYPRWDINASDPRWWLPLLATVAVTCALVWNRNGRWCRPLLFAWGFFLLALVPVMGLVDVGLMRFTLVSDHYLHVAIIGVVALAAAGWSAWSQHGGGTTRVVASLTAAAVVGALMYLAEQQSRLYRDALTLYEATLAQNPNAELVHNNLGLVLCDAGRVDEAIAHYRRALEIKPKYSTASYNLGIALRLAGKDLEAITCFEDSLRLRPNHAESRQQLACALSDAGRAEEAIPHFKEAIRLKRNDWPMAHNNFGLALLKLGRHDEAISEFSVALQQSSDYFNVRVNLGRAMKQSGRLQEAIDHYERALKLYADSHEAHLYLATALRQSGQNARAIDHYRQALRLKPDYFEAHYNLANALGQSKQFDDAIEHYREAMRLKPDVAEVHANLACVYAEMSQREKAIETAQHGLDVARSAGETSVAQRIADWLTAYQSGGASPQQDAQPTP